MAEENKKPELESDAEDTEVNTTTSDEADEDSSGSQDAGISDDEESGSDDDGEHKSSGNIDPVTRAILAEREAATYRERLSYLERQASDANNRQAEQDRLSLMSPDEKAQYIFEKTQNFISQKEQALDAKLRFASFDMQDRTQFVTKYGSHQAYNKLAGQVENKYNDLANKGNPISRKDIFGWLLGQKQLQAIERGTGKKQMNKGAQNVQKSKSNGQAVKSDFQKSATPKGNNIDAIKARLSLGRSGYIN